MNTSHTGVTTAMLDTVNQALKAGDLVIHRGQIETPPVMRAPVRREERGSQPIDLAREGPYWATLDVHCLNHVREHGPMTLAWLYRHLDNVCDANHAEIGESLSRLKREGVLVVVGDEVRAVTRSE
jgi:hypothetical protein